jgi:hypothetical protein
MPNKTKMIPNKFDRFQFTRIKFKTYVPERFGHNYKKLVKKSAAFGKNILIFFSSQGECGKVLSY